MIGHHIHGHGPVRVVVLHGWLSDWTVFAPMLSALDEDRFTFAFMDYRGYGASKAQPGPFTIDAIASDALALTDRLGWERLSVVGHSMGGKAALKVAVRAPERIERIVGVTPVWAGAAPFDEGTTTFFRSAAGSLEARDGIIRATTGERLPAVWSRSLAERSAAASTLEAFAAYFESWAFDDFAAAASRLEQPTLVLAGGQDRNLTEEVLNATWLANLANARLEVLGEAGHYPMLETPPLLAARLQAFLD